METTNKLNYSIWSTKNLLGMSRENLIVDKTLELLEMVDVDNKFFDVFKEKMYLFNVWEVLEKILNYIHKICLLSNEFQNKYKSIDEDQSFIWTNNNE